MKSTNSLLMSKFWILDSEFWNQLISVYSATYCWKLIEFTQFFSHTEDSTFTKLKVKTFLIQIWYQKV